MFKRTAFSAILALTACSLVAQGLDRNIQDVLEERIEQAINGSQEARTLPLIVSKAADYQAVANDQGSLDIAETSAVSGQCSCKDQDSASELVKAVKKTTKKKEKSKKSEKDKETSDELGQPEIEIARLSEQPRLEESQAGVEKAEAEKDETEIDSKSQESEDKLADAKNEEEQTRAKKSGEKDKNKKRNKRHVRGRKGKGKIRGKRSTEGGSKGRAGRNKNTSKTGSKNKKSKK